jgi:hypothetical protein
VLALLAVLDSAAMQLALNPTTTPSEARMCLRMGFTALRRIAAALRWEVNLDPLPDDPINLTFEDFDYAVSALAATGFPMERTPEEAWPHFKAWRVNYEEIAYRLADTIVAPRAPWSGDRRYISAELTMPRRPPHRSPGGKVVREDKYRAGAVGGAGGDAGEEGANTGRSGLFGRGTGLIGPRNLRSRRTTTGQDSRHDD